MDPDDPNYIYDGQIGASSFEKNYEPKYARLNYPGRYWQPSS